ncbi:SPFH domain-containing protein [Herbidospora daliensis]|uniref:SPFH domain-containing protein n=1 Tax=Herbidospora daliensis TaxID=295585 RepID=UPI000783E61D|nr:SPFH domain-containing protein [Herbidospora daliensis]
MVLIADSLPAYTPPGPVLLVSDTPLIWALTAVLVLTMLAVGAFRVVSENERLVMFRFGRLAAVKGPGLAVVLPGVDRVVRVPLDTTYVDFLWLDAVTRDGVAVTVNGAALTSVGDPVAYAMSRDSPNSATLATAETEIRGYVAERDLAELAEPSEGDLSDLSAKIGDRTRDWGVDVTLIEFSRVEVRLKADLVRWAEGFADRARKAAR